MALSPGEARALFERQALLSVRDALDVVQDAQRVMSREPNVVRVRGACVFVVGDIHGQFFDLMRLLDDIGVGDGAVLEERDMQLVFLGDYVDRGAFSSEVMLYLLLLKSLHPTRVWLLRGNHECESISSFYGFRNECRSKYGISAYYHFVSCFQTMPLAALVETSRGRIFCVHGGISPEIRDLAAVDAIDRKREVPTSGALCDLLWSDPALGRGNEPEDISWQANAERGCSFYFSASALFQFLAENDLMAVVRAHEFEEDGLMAHFEGDDYRNLDKRTARDLPPLLTVFSAPNYCDAYGNKGAYLVIRDEPFEWESKHLEAASHPVPSIDGIERSSDIWRQFNQTLPFLPASKEFFDEIVRLSEARAFSSSSDREQKPSFFTNHQSNPVLAPPRTESSPPGDSTADRKRKMTSEIHPQAIRRVLDDEVCKWMQSDDGNLQVFPQQKAFGSRGSCGSLAISGGSDEQSGVLTQQELDMVKLMFSLMDTDGRMVLSAAKISKFVLNILGERISDDVAENYLRALDFDGSGAVEFSDVLSWVATMKINHIRVTAHGNSAINWRGLFALARRWILSRIRKDNLGPTSLWLTLACLLRDLYRSKRYRVTASPLLRFLGCVTTLLYAISLIQPESPIMRMLSSFLWTPQNPRRLSK